ncbi:MAG: 23S rRNA (adenine(1618)-N(6))-methyltransferase RlmF [Methylophilaceae bacterium]|nr:MAG: 23S rRNA (adenine(1618)-N(6))-methyltransferase RlmF [Methylophilaceae bacterium]
MKQIRQTATLSKKPSLEKPDEKLVLHPRNKHRGRYNFAQLILTSPPLGSYVFLNDYNDSSIDFANPKAVKALNCALLKHFYNIAEWDIPSQYLCPPIPGRADYVHHLADLLASDTKPTLSKKIRVLDIGVGANAIYPLIGFREYGWQFVGADVDLIALKNAQTILEANPGLASAIELRLQTSSSSIFSGIVKDNEHFDLTMCNPPFHASLAEAKEGTQRKWQNLGKAKPATLNFGGQGAELFCEGGEIAFISRMIVESATIGSQFFWFSSLVSKASNLPEVYKALKTNGARQVKTINMAQGQKQSRFVAWTFLTPEQQKNWRKH